MKTLIAVVVLALASATTAAAKEKSVSGTWTMKAEGYVLKLVLVQQRTKISGELHGPHGPMPASFKKMAPSPAISRARHPDI